MVKKHILDVDDVLWREIQKWKIDYGCKNLNEALIKIIKRGLSKL